MLDSLKLDKSCLVRLHKCKSLNYYNVVFIPGFNETRFF